MTMVTTALTPQKATKRNANRQKKSYRAHRGAPSYYSKGTLVAHCHKCRLTHPMGQHLISTTTRSKQPATNDLTRHPEHTRLNRDRPKQKTILTLLDKNPDTRESLGHAHSASPIIRQHSPNSNQVSLHPSTHLKEGTQPTEIQKRFKRNSGRRRWRDGSRIYRAGPMPTYQRPTTDKVSSL